jgi:hypothetical protein
LPQHPCDLDDTAWYEDGLNLWALEGTFDLRYSGSPEGHYVNLWTYDVGGGRLSYDGGRRFDLISVTIMDSPTCCAPDGFAPLQFGWLVLGAGHHVFEGVPGWQNLPWMTFGFAIDLEDAVVAIDDITVRLVPEPSAALMVLGGALIASWRRRRLH